MERAIGEGSERTPLKWVARWPLAVQEGFWKAVSRRWPQHSGYSMEALLKLSNDGRKKPLPWGQWEPEASARFAVLPVDSPLPPPDALLLVGLVPELDDHGLSTATLSCIEKAKENGLDVWLDVPSTPDLWDRWGVQHWRQCHRLGVAVWFQPPVQERWNDYVGFLEKQAARLVRQTDWEQWVWPVCDLLEYSMEDVLVYGKPVHRSGLPWKWEGRCKTPDWLKARRQIWEASSNALGGPGALDEVLVASVLANDQLLLP